MARKATIDDVRAAGLTVALASGSVEVEEAALAEARKAASEKTVAGEAEQVAGEVASLAVAQGKTGTELEAIVARATRRALEQIGEARNKRVAFHERALAAAQEMPDVYFVSALGDPDTTEDDVQVYVACKPDGTGWDKGAQQILDALVASAE